MILAVSIALAITMTNEGKGEYEKIGLDECLLGTSSFEVADTEQSGTWTKGTVFAIDREDKILLRVIGEMEMGENDPWGIKICAAPESKAGDIVQRTEHILNPPIEVVSACLDSEKSSTSPLLQTPNKGEVTIGFTYIDAYRATGGGTYMIDFETNDAFNRSEGKIDLSISAGVHYSITTVYLH